MKEDPAQHKYINIRLQYATYTKLSKQVQDEWVKFNSTIGYNELHEIKQMMKIKNDVDQKIDP